ncbi:hypothetical protein RDE2_51310 (plasmid) [Rhodococcus sp. RDE2]|nr:hypothetical protein RDE2_51310 [Rhodococcus sp. RDE2]
MRGAVSTAYTADMGEPWVDRERLADAANLFAEKVDVLLDRVVDSAIGPARAHSADQLRDDSEARLLTRIAIAHRAGVDPVLDVQRALRVGMTWEQIGDATGIGASPARTRWSTDQPVEGTSDNRSRRRRSVDDQQMSMW